MAYSLMIAPSDFANHNRIAARQFFDNYAFFELTARQAKEYFNWYMEQIPNRISAIIIVLAATRAGTEDRLGGF